MDALHFSDEYHRLRDELTRLNAQPVKDMRAIDELIDALEAEQFRLKAQDGQPGNNPVEGKSTEFHAR